MSAMTDERLKEIRARADAASGERWRYCRDGVNHDGEPNKGSVMGGGYWIAKIEPDGPHPEEDAEFIAHARQDVPDLLDYIATLEARLASTPCAEH